jgi:acetolactate synthase-1/2/3 large subunit
MRGFDRAYGGKQTEQARELWVFTEVDFAAMAEQMGAIGIRVEKPSEFAPAMERALEADRPVIIDVVTDIEAVAPAAVV